MRSGRVLNAPALNAAAVVCLTAFAAVLPMLLRGPSCGHDFDFHLLNWLEAASQFAHLQIPHWAYTPAYNAGEPRFLFYPPISWTLGALLGLILPWDLVPAAYTWIALTLAGLTMLRLARNYASPAAATLTATLYLANPYMLLTAYERTAYAELLAAAFMPLLFAAILAERVRILPIAGALALLWLTNAPAAVMSSYALAFLTAGRLVQPSLPSSLFPLPSRAKLALTATAGTLLGLALAAFYVVPAAYERRFVQIAMVNVVGMRPSEHFLFHHMAGNTFEDRFHDQVVRTASIVALILMAAIVLALLAAYKSHQNERTGHPPQDVCHPSRSGGPASRTFPVLPLALLAAFIAFMLTPPSLWLWNHIPQLAYLQFPWRLSALLAVILCLFTAIAASHWRPSLHSALLPLLSLALAATLILPAWLVFHQSCDLEDSVPFRVALFHSNIGSEPTDEYTPIHADPDALGTGDPAYWLIPSATPDAIDTPPPAGSQPGQAPTHLTVNLPTPEVLVLNRRQYPSWQVLLNGKTAALDARDDGLIAVPLPAGQTTIDLVYAHTLDQTAGLVFSVLACLIALVLRRRTSPTPGAPSSRQPYRR